MGPKAVRVRLSDLSTGQSLVLQLNLKPLGSLLPAWLTRVVGAPQEEKLKQLRKEREGDPKRTSGTGTVPTIINLLCNTVDVVQQKVWDGSRAEALRLEPQVWPKQQLTLETSDTSGTCTEGCSPAEGGHIQG
ncbi:hypothetical protein NDU88_006381 [Pleurodeles waltl]|uniref:Uncharacterized protein n=1 Tax=Pleurodeles waltl TaxID=8319 RepID=A0AAV7MC28_PLEWA|nr:hypothetical protein NDU88_006381 [Pleurodeles waltl]